MRVCNGMVWPGLLLAELSNPWAAAVAPRMAMTHRRKTLNLQKSKYTGINDQTNNIFIYFECRVSAIQGLVIWSS